MNTNEKDGLKRQRVRQKRVARMKLYIVGGVFGLLMILAVFCIILSVKVANLQKSMNSLLEQVTTLQTEASAKQSVVEDETALASGTSASDSASDSSTQTTDTDTSTQATVDTAVEYGVDAHQEIYLTFDDGPSENTEQIMDILDQHGVNATFFVVGKDDDVSKALYKEIVDRGNTLGMHSYSHKYSELYASEEAFAEDIQKEKDLLYQATGVEPWLFRFPGGSSNLVTDTDMSELISYLNQQNITYFDWNVSCGDATSQPVTTQELIDNVMEDIGKHQTAVILMHDTNNKDTTVEALDSMLTQLEQRDADIKPIDKNTKLVQHVKADSVND